MIGWIINQLVGGLWPYVAAGAVALVGVLGSYMAGKRHARQKAKIEGLEGYKETREKIDGAPASDNPADAAEWLSERNPKQR